jgi:hypothetical protein
VHYYTRLPNANQVARPASNDGSARSRGDARRGWQLSAPAAARFRLRACERVSTPVPTRSGVRSGSRAFGVAMRPAPPAAATIQGSSTMRARLGRHAGSFASRPVMKRRAAAET